MSTPEEGSCIYDHPLYYDILFGWDRDAEAAFYDGALRAYGVPAGGRVIEIAGGTGQVARRLARRGFRVLSLDISTGMTAFLSRAAAEEGVSVDALPGDMADFTLPEPVDGAFCPMGSLCVLGGDALAIAHLTCMGRCLRSGGIYILDIGFVATPQAAPADSFETWTMERGRVTVAAEGRTIRVSDGERGVELTLNWGEGLRVYTAAELLALVGRSGVFDVAGWHPELRPGGEGISRFDLAVKEAQPCVGRGMLVLRRR